MNLSVYDEINENITSHVWILMHLCLIVFHLVVVGDAHFKRKRSKSIFLHFKMYTYLYKHKPTLITIKNTHHTLRCLLPSLLLGRDILASAPTGSGKTAAFVIPVLSKLGAPKKVGVRGLLLAPTKELAGVFTHYTLILLLLLFFSSFMYVMFYLSFFLSFLRSFDSNHKVNLIYLTTILTDTRTYVRNFM